MNRLSLFAVLFALSIPMIWQCSQPTKYVYVKEDNGGDIERDHGGETAREPTLDRVVVSLGLAAEDVAGIP